MAHAKNSPSSSEGWFNCAQYESDSNSSKAADAGTARHEWTAMILLGQEVATGQESKDAPGYFYGEDEAADVAIAVKNVHERIEQFKLRGAVHVELMVEVKLLIDHITGEHGAKGTSDVVLLVTWADGSMHLDVTDHKFGYRAVNAYKNKQGLMYVSAAVREFSLLGEFATASFAINQPSANPSIHDYEFNTDELIAFEAEAYEAATRHGAPDAVATPGAHCDKAYCAKRATCPALRGLVMSAFEDIKPKEETPADQLAEAMSKVDLIESWVKAIRAETERRLLAGEPVRGFKLVQGRMGNRKWANPKEAEETLKGMRLKVEEMYDLSLISPTKAEKLAESKVIGPRQWKKVIPLIVRAEGQPSVAPESDKRPALVVEATVDDFDVVQAAEDFV